MDQGHGPDGGKNRLTRTRWIDKFATKQTHSRQGIQNTLSKPELVSKVHSYQLNFYVVHVQGCSSSLSGKIDKRRRKQYLNIAMFGSL